MTDDTTATPFRILGQDRPSRWLITCDHATNRVPDWVGGGTLGIAPADMARHIAYDVGAAGLTERLAERLDAPAILSDFSRLVIDPNRGEDDPTLLMRLYDGTVIPTNRLADAAERQRRLDRLHRPYHAALARVAALHPDRCICAVHSFTPQLRGARRGRGRWASSIPMPIRALAPRWSPPAAIRAGSPERTSPMTGIWTATASIATPCATAARTC